MRKIFRRDLFIGRGGLPSWKESLLMGGIWSASYLMLVLVAVGNVWALEKLGLLKKN